MPSTASASPCSRHPLTDDFGRPGIGRITTWSRTGVERKSQEEVYEGASTPRQSAHPGAGGVTVRRANWPYKRQDPFGSLLEAGYHGDCVLTAQRPVDSCIARPGDRCQRMTTLASQIASSPDGSHADKLTTLAAYTGDTSTVPAVRSAIGNLRHVQQDRTEADTGNHQRQPAYQLCGASQATPAAASSLQAGATA